MGARDLLVRQSPADEGEDLLLTFGQLSGGRRSSTGVQERARTCGSRGTAARRRTDRLQQVGRIRVLEHVPDGAGVQGPQTSTGAASGAVDAVALTAIARGSVESVRRGEPDQPAGGLRT